jgi:hypothetical protein
MQAYRKDTLDSGSGLITTLPSALPPAFVKEINTRQQELDEITRQLLTTEPDSISAEIGRIRQFVTGQRGGIGPRFG